MRAEELVGRADEEVAPERRDVDRAVRRVVDGVDVGERARLAAERGEPGDVVDRPGAVRGPAERGDTRSPGELRGEVVDVDDARLRVDAGLADGDAAVARRQHPGGDVGVVVEARHEDLVAGTERAAEDPRGVQGEGRHVGAEDDLGAGRCSEERRGLGARLLEHGVAGLRGHERPAEVGVLVAVVGLDGLVDRPVHLRAAGVVEEDTVAVDRREAGADRGDVGGGGKGVHAEIVNCRDEARHPWRRPRRICRRLGGRARGRRGDARRGALARRELHDDRRDSVEDAAHDGRRDARGGARRGGRA